MRLEERAEFGCFNNGMPTTTMSLAESRRSVVARTGFFSADLDKLYVAVRRHESQGAEIRVYKPAL